MYSQSSRIRIRPFYLSQKKKKSTYSLVHHPGSLGVRGLEKPKESRDQPAHPFGGAAHSL